MGAFVAATFAGLFAGPLCLSFLSDRYGRKSVFLWTLLAYSAASVVMAFQTSPSGLLLWRFLGGVGLGLEIVTIDAYLVELVSPAMRGRAFALSQAIMFTSVPVVALIAWQLVLAAALGLAGWRWVVLIGAAGAVAVWFVRLRVPESPLWLTQVGRHAEAAAVLARLEAQCERDLGRPLPPPEPLAEPAAVGRAPFAALFRAPNGGRLAMLIAFNVFQVIGLYGFANWVPTLLLAKGITVTRSLGYSALIAIAAPVGPLLGMLFADRIDRKWVIVAAAILIGAVGTAFGQLPDPALLVLCGVVITLGNNVLSYYHAYQVEVFPTRIRARAAGLVYSTSRLAGLSSGLPDRVRVAGGRPAGRVRADHRVHGGRGGRDRRVRAVGALPTTARVKIIRDTLRGRVGLSSCCIRMKVPVVHRLRRVTVFSMEQAVPVDDRVLSQDVVYQRRVSRPP